MVADALVLGVFPAALSLAIATDLFRRVIPNTIVLVLVAAFAGLWMVGGVPDLALRIAAATAILGAGFALFARDVIGAGDAKLAGALALWLDPAQLPLFLLLCGLLGLALVAAEGLRAWLAPARAALVPTLPYGVALAGAGLLLFPQSGLMAALS